MPPTDLRPRASNSLAEHGSLPARAVEMPSSGAMVKPRWPIAPSQRTASSLSPMARLARRDLDKPADTDDSSERMINLMLTVLGLVFLALALTALLVLRRRRLMRQRHQQQQQQQLQQDLPAYNVKQAPTSHGLAIETAHEGRSSILYIGRDGQPMLQNPNSPPHSPENVPEIHITFPDESDDNGHPQSGRVLVVRVGDNATVGLEPMHDEQLPAYEKEVKGQFQSIDMDQIGGLKEKDRSTFQ